MARLCRACVFVWRRNYKWSVSVSSSLVCVFCRVIAYTCKSSSQLKTYIFLFLLPLNKCCCLRCDVTRAGVGTEVASSRDVTTRNSSQLQASSRSTSIASLRKNHFPQIYCFDSLQIDVFARRTPESRAAHRQIRCILGVARFDSDLLHCGAWLLLGLCNCGTRERCSRVLFGISGISGISGIRNLRFFPINSSQSHTKKTESEWLLNLFPVVKSCVISTHAPMPFPLPSSHTRVQTRSLC